MDYGTASNADVKVLFCLFLSTCVVQTVCACAMDFVSDYKLNSWKESLFKFQPGVSYNRYSEIV